MPQRGGSAILTGDAVVADVKIDKTFYSDDASNKLTGLTIFSEYSALSDILIHNNEPKRSQTGDAYFKVKEIDFDIQIAIPTFRTKITLDGQTYNMDGKIYKNGNPLGTERSPSSPPTSYTEDLAFSRGDLYQVYVKSSSEAGSCSAEDQKITGDLALITGILTDQDP